MDGGETNKLTALRHEPVETDVRAVWRTGGAMAVVVIATFVLIIGLMKWFAAAQGAPAANYAASKGSGPDEQVSLQKLRVQEQIMLDDYEWVDQANGMARIPVGRAMEIISESGLPAALQSPVAAEPARTEQTRSSGNLPANVGGDEQ
ncbi:MAG TPA: hypothetical protein VGK58_01365 [Lacipirellulaceae bacterium]